MKNFMKKKKPYNEWIKTDEQLPPLNQWVLVWKGTLSYTPEIAKYQGETFRNYYQNGQIHKEIFPSPLWLYQNMSAIDTEHPLAWRFLPIPPYELIGRR